MLHNFKPAHGSRPKCKRVARGNSAGGGTTAGRGTKGQQSRVGKGRKFGFEGGQVPLLMRQPKLGGFKRERKIHYEAITLQMLERRLEAGSYDISALRAKRIVRTSGKVKILSGGALTKKFNLSVHAASRSAREAIAKLGGSVIIVRDRP